MTDFIVGTLALSIERPGTSVVTEKGTIIFRTNPAILLVEIIHTNRVPALLQVCMIKALDAMAKPSQVTEGFPANVQEMLDAWAMWDFSDKGGPKAIRETITNLLDYHFLHALSVRLAEQAVKSPELTSACKLELAWGDVVMNSGNMRIVWDIAPKVVFEGKRRDVADRAVA